LYKSTTISNYSKKGLQQLLKKLQYENDFLNYSHSQMNQEASHSLSKAFCKTLENLNLKRNINNKVFIFLIKIILY